MKSKKVKIDLDLDGDTYKFLKDVSKLSKVTMDDVVSVILSMEIIKNKKGKK